MQTGADVALRPGRCLGDLRILALEQYGAGPFATAQLVDLGADVIKIEDPGTGGDVGRSVPPFAHEGASVFFESFNRGKRSVTLDLANAVGREMFERLVTHADVLFANVRGDVPDRLRLRYRHLAHLNERIVCCFLSTYGIESSRQREPGYDYVLQGRAGWMSLTGEPDDPPEKTGLSLVDYSTGLAAAIAIVAGVHEARKTGRGTDCDLSLFDTAIGMLSYVGAWHLTAGFEPRRTHSSAHPSIVPFQAFRTADGYLVVACAKEKFWQRLADAVGDPSLRDDPRFCDFASRQDNAQVLLARLAELFVSRTTAEWLPVLEAAGVPCGPVNDVGGALRDPLVAERGMIVETDHPTLGRVRQLAGLVRVGSFEPVTRRAPLLGEHTGEVLSELLGVDQLELAELAKTGAFGPNPTSRQSSQASVEGGA